MSQVIKKFNIGRIMVALLTVFVLLPLVPITVQAVEASGECGNGVGWELDGGTLTISGTGDMEITGNFLRHLGMPMRT